MIFLPKGVKNGEVVDPSNLARDYQEANRVASSTTQYQWHNESFTDIDKFDDTLCKVHYKKSVAKLQETGRSGAQLSGLNNPVVVNVATSGTVSVTSDANLFDVPQNKGFQTITETEITWTSEYAELVHFTFSFQYLRDTLASYEVVLTDHAEQPGDLKYSKYPQIRLQVMIELDGALIVGTGPYGVNTEGSFRGLGYAGRSLVTSVNTMQLVEAGFHTVRAKCCILPLTNINNNELDEGRSIRLKNIIGSNSATSGINSWDNNVNIGNRSMIVTRYGRGMFLGA
tara:strand:+ start:1901 stop:2755 length:855 start_codon:yes stop_codon:yes gene_type:complete